MTRSARETAVAGTEVAPAQRSEIGVLASGEDAGHHRRTVVAHPHPAFGSVHGQLVAPRIRRQVAYEAEPGPIQPLHPCFGALVPLGTGPLGVGDDVIDLAGEEHLHRQPLGHSGRAGIDRPHGGAEVLPAVSEPDEEVGFEVVAVRLDERHHAGIQGSDAPKDVNAGLSWAVAGRLDVVHGERGVDDHIVPHGELVPLVVGHRLGNGQDPGERDVDPELLARAGEGALGVGEDRRARLDADDREASGQPVEPGERLEHREFLLTRPDADIDQGDPVGVGEHAGEDVVGELSGAAHERQVGGDEVEQRDLAQLQVAEVEVHVGGRAAGSSGEGLREDLVGQVAGIGGIEVCEQRVQRRTCRTVVVGGERLGRRVEESGAFDGAQPHGDPFSSSQAAADATSPAGH